MRAQILVLQTSNLARDSRVLRQIELLASFGDVISVGFGSAPPSVTDHIELPNGTSALPTSPRGVAQLLLRRHVSAEGSSPFARQVRTLVTNRSWDLVVANNARTFDIAFEVAGNTPVWTDLHEWHPEEQAQIRRWRALVGPYFTYLCARYLPRAALITTVAPHMSALFKERFGVESLVLPNAPRHDACTAPASIGGTDSVRLVFVGAAEQSRGIDTLLDAATLLPPRYSLDLYLVQGSSNRYFDALKKRVALLPHVRLCDPVPPSTITRTLATYDVGVYSMPIINRNVAVTIPNKFFDFVHANLAVAIGPIPQIAELVEMHGIGVVAQGFSGEDLAKAILTIDAEALARYKNASCKAAPALSFDAYEPQVLAALKRLLELRDA